MLSTTIRRLSLASLLVPGLAPLAHAEDLVTSWRAAVAHDATFAAARNALVAGRERAVQGDALLKPQVGVTGAVEQDYSAYHSGRPQSKASETTSGQQLDATVQLVQPVYNKGATVTRDQYHKQTEQAQVQYLVSEQDLILRTATAYFNVLLAQENLNLVKAQKEAVSQQLAQAQKMFEIGLSSVTDSDEAQARFDTILASEIAARNDLEVKASAYRNLTALDPAALQPISAVVADAAIRSEDLNATLPTLLDRAGSSNLNVRAQQLGLDIARFQIDRYRLESQPVVSLVASYGHGLANGSISSSGGRDNTGTARIGLQLSIPLYTGGARDSQLREAVALADQQRDTLEAAQRDAQQLTTQYFLDVASGQARIRALEQARVSASSSLESSKTGREVGVRTTIDVLNAEQNYYQAIYNLVSARYGYLFSRLQLAAAIGDLDEKELAGVNRWLVGEPLQPDAPAAVQPAAPSPVMPSGPILR